MPELPEVTALAEFVAAHAGGQQVAAFTVASLNVLSTYDPPPTALVGRTVTGATRHGKFLDVVVGPPPPGGPGPDAELHLVVHLARAGWLRWSDQLSPAPPKMGGPIALRLRLASGAGFDITEAGTKKSVAAAIVTDPRSVPGVARLGPDPLSLDVDGFAAALRGRTGRIKTVITDQTVLAGIGNAYSDEILHTAKLSPFATAATLTPDQLLRLYTATVDVLTAAVARTVGAGAARLKGEKRTGLRVHARTGLPCPVCGDTVAEVSFADRSFQYCPTCQTGGRLLADRRLSRLIK
ncbi:Fpg/Nei family DNA glycosylase [Nakamurella endophytica]|uniref:Formamidopyrimidine-DNA glycosylase n=1 Tax=Nakamurella endophytica TaxID=1748367 RepID=A0A917T605_9ACTN|nr:Fpg/Nei family DNA glycosylase [Nakamurella endophytica]GGM10735.1 formamidopyrimidine-DNA glycosylase [Nakamurella endophytica]